MTDTPSAPGPPAPVSSTAATGPGLAARLLGVVLSPRPTFEAIAARPRALGALAVVIAVLVAVTTAFLSTELGLEITLDQQVRQIEAFGGTVTDQMYAQLESRMSFAKYFAGISQLVFVPLFTAVIAGLVMGVFTTLLGGAATFKQAYAVVAHAGVIPALQQLFSIGLTFLRGDLAGANLGVFAPMLEETSFLARLLGSIDLFGLWWCVTLAIGIGALYRRRAGGISASLIGIYLFIVTVVAFVRSGV
jgi:hypothetical protein